MIAMGYNSASGMIVILVFNSNIRNLISLECIPRGSNSITIHTNAYSLLFVHLSVKSMRLLSLNQSTS